MYRLYLAKSKIENLFIYPFVLLGRVIGSLQERHDYDIYFFFPFYHIGGAEKVHAQVARSFKDKKAIIYYTKKSLNDFFWNEFEEAGHKMVDVSKYTDNKWMYFNNLIYRGIMSYHINKQKDTPIVFNGQCNFGYKLSPWVKATIPQIELIHSLCSFSYIRIPFMQYYYKTVMISKKRIKDHENLYDQYKIPAFYKQKIEFILNGIKLPERVKETVNQNSTLKVLYVGRDTEEKRVDLIAKVGKQIIASEKLDAQFIFMGEVASAIPPALHPYCTFLGNKSDESEIDRIYRDADVLLMLSTTEGFPMAIMEAMARGLTIVSTAVGEIPYHVKDGANGFLIQNEADNDAVFTQAVNYIVMLVTDRNLLSTFRTNNIAHAKAHFGIERFQKQYRDLFEEAKKHSS